MSVLQTLGGRPILNSPRQGLLSPCVARQARGSASAVHTFVGRWSFLKSGKPTPEERVDAPCIARVQWGALTPVLDTVTPEFAFNFISMLLVPIYTLMIVVPRARLTRSIVQSPVLTVGLACLYGIVMVHSCADGLIEKLLKLCRTSFPLPDVSAMASVVGHSSVTALTWVHLLLLDFLLAREVFLDGLRRRILTAHSVILCFMFGPTGILSHMLTLGIHSMFTNFRRMGVPKAA